MTEKKNTYQRSPLFYVGDKYKLLPSLLPLFPTEIDTFYEPFVGGGSVSLNTSAKKYKINDANEHIVELHRFLMAAAGDVQDFFDQNEKLILHYNLSRSYIEDVVPEKLKAKHKKTYYARYNKDAYTQMRSDYNAQDDRSIRMLYLLLIYGFNRMIRFNSKGDFNLPVGNVDFNKNTEKALLDFFEKISIMDIDIRSQDFEDFIIDQNFGAGDFVYLDPPYLITYSEYNKIWTEAEEKRLLNLLDAIDAQGVRFAISNVTRYKGRRNPLFEKWSQNYQVHDIKSNYISYHDNTNKEFTEVLVTNYLPKSLES